MNIKINYVPSHEAITVQGGFIDNGEFQMEWCNHTGAEESESNTWSASATGEPVFHKEVFNACDKCDETWDIN